MRSFRLSRKQPEEDSGDESELAKLRWRCRAGAAAGSSAYLAVLIIASLRPTALHEVVTYGLLVGSGTVAAMCTLGATLMWAVSRVPVPPVGAEAEDIKWAIRFGEELADSFRGTPAARLDRK